MRRAHHSTSFTHGMRPRLDRQKTQRSIIRRSQSGKPVELRIERPRRPILRMPIPAIRVGLPELHDEAGHGVSDRVQKAGHERDRLAVGVVREQGRDLRQILRHRLNEHAGVEGAEGRFRREVHPSSLLPHARHSLSCDRTRSSRGVSRRNHLPRIFGPAVRPHPLYFTLQAPETSVMIHRASSFFTAHRWFGVWKTFERVPGVGGRLWDCRLAGAPVPRSSSFYSWRQRLCLGAGRHSQPGRYDQRHEGRLFPARPSRPRIPRRARRARRVERVRRLQSAGSAARRLHAQSRTHRIPHLLSHENVLLRVDSTTRTDAEMALGGVAETVTVTEADADHQHDRRQRRPDDDAARRLRRCRSKGGTSCICSACSQVPSSSRRRTPIRPDPRYGSVAGARADQQNVTLDGVDVNDPQLQAAYTSAVRMTQEALQEFRVSTSNYGAEAGRSSGAAGVARHEERHQRLQRIRLRVDAAHRDVEQRVLPEACAGPGAASRARRRSSTKTSFGGVDRRADPARIGMFFFGNYEALREDSETPVVRNVPSDSIRDGVLMYQCAVASACPGGSAQRLQLVARGPGRLVRSDPSQIAAIDPLGIGPSRAASQYFQAVPVAERDGNRRQEPDGFPFRRADREQLQYASSAAWTTG